MQTAENISDPRIEMQEELNFMTTINPHIHLDELKQVAPTLTEIIPALFVVRDTVAPLAAAVLHWQVFACTL